MKFVMFVCSDPEPDVEPEGSGDGQAELEDWVDRNDAAGVRLMGDRLRPASEALVIRKRAGKVQVTEGPYAETAEWILGFDVLECPDLDAAIAVAADHEMARGGRIELRAFWPIDDEA